MKDINALAQQVKEQINPEASFMLIVASKNGKIEFRSNIDQSDASEILYKIFTNI